MTSQPHSFLPVSVEQFVTGSPAEQRAWLGQSADSLEPNTLLALEAQLCQAIEARHPDNPASLLNSWHQEGKQLKAKVHNVFSEALLQQARDKVDYLVAVRQLLLEDDFLTMLNERYGTHRDAVRLRRRDQLEEEVQADLAHDHELQRQLALTGREHQHRQEWAQLEHDLAMDTQQVMATIERARRRLDQPHELHLRLYQVLEGLNTYQMSLNDRAMRNPALEDRLRMMGMGLTAVMSSVQSLITELNRAGGQTAEPEQLREQSEHILNLAMEQMQQWQDQTQQEPDL
jgi:hypothetical protein